MKKIKNVVKAVGVIGLVGCAVISTQAVAGEDAFWYGGASVGQSKAKIDDARIASQLQGVGLTTASMNNEESDTGYKIFAGYKFNKNFALEGGYFDLGKFGFTSTTSPAGTLTGNIKLKGVNLDAVGIWPLTEKFSALGRIGMNYAQAQDNFANTGAVPVPTTPDPEKSALNYKAGLGLQYDFTKHIGLRVEGERYRIDDAVGNQGDVDLYSIGLVVMFGDDKPAPEKKAEAPPPAMVEQAPIWVIVPVKVKTQRYCSVLDIQFEIKQDEMQREEKERLAVLGTYMKKYPDTTAVIEGHSDNVGEGEYNMKLSQRRAESVVSYLVDNQHIAPSRLSAVGYGETRPVADNRTAEGRQANRRIDAVIACVTDIADLKVAKARVTMAMELEFDPYKSTIDPVYHDELGRVANFMKANPTVTATVEGHAGKYVGMGDKKVHVSPEKSMEVSQARAQNVVNYLVDKLGVPRSRLSTAAYGQTRRVAYGITLEGQQENRRVNIIFNYAK